MSGFQSFGACVCVCVCLCGVRALFIGPRPTDAGGDVVAALAALHAALLTRVGASPTLWRRHWDPTLPVDVECDALTPSPQDDAGFEAESLGSIYSESECSVMDVASGAEGAPATVSAWRLVSVRCVCARRVCACACHPVFEPDRKSVV